MAGNAGGSGCSALTEQSLTFGFEFAEDDFGCAFYLVAVGVESKAEVKVNGATQFEENATAKPDATPVQFHGFPSSVHANARRAVLGPQRPQPFVLRL